MKRLLLALIVSTFSASVAAEWVKLGEIDGDSYFYDPETIRVTGDFRSAWSIVDSSSQETDGAVSTLVQFEYECSEEMFRVLAIAAYSGRMGTGKALFVAKTSSDEWGPITPDSPIATTLRLVCFN